MKTNPLISLLLIAVLISTALVHSMLHRSTLKKSIALARQDISTLISHLHEEC